MIVFSFTNMTHFVRVVTNLDFQGIQAREIEFYLVRIVSRKLSFYVCDQAFRWALRVQGRHGLPGPRHGDALAFGCARKCCVIQMSCSW